jgi:hypothetical protein
MSQFTQHDYAQILKNGSSTPSEWFDWKKLLLVADDDVKAGIAELVAGKKMTSGYAMSNSYPSLKKRFGQQSEALEALKNDMLAPLADQNEATKLVSKLIEDMDFLSKVMVTQQSDTLFKQLKEMLSLHKTRLISYSALCQQRSIVEVFEQETLSKLVKKLEGEIEKLEERQEYYQNGVNGAPDATARKIAQDNLRKTNIELREKRTELTEKKGNSTVFDPSDSTEFATQVYDDDDDDDEDEEETEEQKILKIKDLLRSEYECRGSRKRKATEVPDGASSSSSPPKKQKGFFGVLSEAMFG